MEDEERAGSSDLTSSNVPRPTTPEQPGPARGSTGSTGEGFLMNDVTTENARPRSCPLDSSELQFNTITTVQAGDVEKYTELLILHQDLLLKSREFERQANQRIDQLQRQNQDLINENNDVNARVNELSSMLTHQVDQIDAMEHQLSDLNEDKKKGTVFLQEQMVEHETEVLEYRQRIDQLESELRDWERGKREVLGAPSTSEAQVQTLDDQVERTAVEQVHDVVLPFLDCLNDNLSTVQATVEERCTLLNDRLVNISNDKLLTLADRFSALLKEKNVGENMACSDRDAVFSELNTIKLDKSRLENELASLSARYRAREQHTDLANKVKGELDKANGEIKQLNKENCRLLEESKYAQRQFEQCSEELNWYKQKHSHFNTEQLAAAHARLVVERDQLVEQMERMNEENGKEIRLLSQQIVDCEHIASTVEREKTSLTSELHSLKEQHEQLQSDYECLEREHQALEENISLQIAQQQDKISQLTAETDTQQREVMARLEEIQTQQAHQRASHQEDIEQLNSQLVEEKNKCQQLEEQLRESEEINRRMANIGSSGDEVDSVISKSPTSARSNPGSADVPPIGCQPTAVVDARVGVGNDHDRIQVLREAFGVFAKSHSSVNRAQPSGHKACLEHTCVKVVECVSQWTCAVIKKPTDNTTQFKCLFDQLYTVLLDIISSSARSLLPPSPPRVSEQEHRQLQTKYQNLIDTADSLRQELQTLEEHNTSLSTDLREAERSLSAQNDALANELAEKEHLNERLKHVERERATMSEQIRLLCLKVDEFADRGDQKDLLLDTAAQTITAVTDQLTAERQRCDRLDADNTSMFNENQRLRRQITDLQHQAARQDDTQGAMATRYYNQLQQLKSDKEAMIKRGRQVDQLVQQILAMFNGTAGGDHGNVLSANTLNGNGQGQPFIPETAKRAMRMLEKCQRKLNTAPSDSEASSLGDTTLTAPPQHVSDRSNSGSNKSVANVTKRLQFGATTSGNLVVSRVSDGATTPNTTMIFVDKENLEPAPSTISPGSVYQNRLRPAGNHQPVVDDSLLDLTPTLDVGV